MPPDASPYPYLPKSPSSDLIQTPNSYVKDFWLGLPSNNNNRLGWSDGQAVYSNYAQPLKTPNLKTYRVSELGMVCVGIRQGAFTCLVAGLPSWYLGTLQPTEAIQCKRLAAARRIGYCFLCSLSLSLSYTPLERWFVMIESTVDDPFVRFLVELI